VNELHSTVISSEQRSAACNRTALTLLSQHARAMHRRASAAARLVRRAAAAAPSPPFAADATLAPAATARSLAARQLPRCAAAGFHTSSAERVSWGRIGSGDEPPVISLGQTRSTPHVGIVICPQQSAMVVERLGKFDRVLEPGLHLLIPLVSSGSVRGGAFRGTALTRARAHDAPPAAQVDRVGYTWSLKEEAIPIKAQQARGATAQPLRVGALPAVLCARNRLRALTVPSRARLRHRPSRATT
jgi:hypothetical protein